MKGVIGTTILLLVYCEAGIRGCYAGCTCDELHAFIIRNVRRKAVADGAVITVINNASKLGPLRGHINVSDVEQ